MNNLYCKLLLKSLLLSIISLPSISCTQKLIEVNIEMVDLEIKTPPNNISYYVGDTLSLEGLTVTASYSTGATSDISYLDLLSNDIYLSIPEGTVLSESDSEIVISSYDESISDTQYITVLSVTPSDLTVNKR